MNENKSVIVNTFRNRECISLAKENFQEVETEMEYIIQFHQFKNDFLGQLKTLGTQMGYPNGVPIWVLQKKPNKSSRLLTMLLRLSIVKPINNQNCQKSLGFRVKNIKLNLP